MTIKNFDVQATLVNGTAIENDGKTIVLKDVIADMLCGNYQDESSTLSGLEKFERASLALKVKKGGDINFETKELATIKEIIGKRGTVPIVYQAFNILDGE